MANFPFRPHYDIVSLLDEPAFMWWEVWVSDSPPLADTSDDYQTGSKRPLRGAPGGGSCHRRVAASHPLFTGPNLPRAADAHQRARDPRAQCAAAPARLTSSRPAAPPSVGSEGGAAAEGSDRGISGGGPRTDATDATGLDLLCPKRCMAQPDMGIPAKIGTPAVGFGAHLMDKLFSEELLLSGLDCAPRHCAHHSPDPISWIRLWRCFVLEFHQGVSFEFLKV